LNPPEFVTFTGLDYATDLDRVEELSHRYPVEWGVLFSGSRAGREPRYPATEVIQRFRARGLRMAAHLCGDYARRALCVPTMNETAEQVEGFSRVQVNYAPNPQHWPELRVGTGMTLGFEEAGRFADCVGRPVILQSRSVRNWPDITRLPVAAQHHLHFLYDLSGGRGKAPAKWPLHPGGPKLVGYAGGLGPHNVASVVQAVGAGGPYWLDMESGVRTEQDLLDLDRVQQVCAAVYG